MPLPLERCPRAAPSPHTAVRCAGFDRVDLAAAEAAGMQVVRVPTYSPRTVAEHAMALSYCLAR